MEEQYLAQARLMLEMVPSVMRSSSLALKGGTAINFFVRELPRLSVDIDLTYMPMKARDDSLRDISSALLAAKGLILEQNRELRVQEKRISGGHCVSLIVTAGSTFVNIEANTVLRGCVFPSQERELTSAATERLNLDAFVIARTLSFADLYAGKLVAALDRQHPRDIFDIKILLKNEGITDDIRKSFVVYLASHNRPMHELLAPRRVDLRSAFNDEFDGMTLEPVTLDELNDVRDGLLDMLPRILTDAQRRFLLSLKQGDPQWDLLGLEGIENLPALQWKLGNVRKMDKAKQTQGLDRLKRVLEL